MHLHTDRIAHTTTFGTPVMEHHLEWEIAQWVHHEGSIRWPITPWADALTKELHLAPGTSTKMRTQYLPASIKAYASDTVPPRPVKNVWWIKELSSSDQLYGLQFVDNTWDYSSFLCSPLEVLNIRQNRCPDLQIFYVKLTMYTTQVFPICVFS